DPLPELEGGILRAEDARHARHLGGAVRLPAPAKTVQPAQRSLRAGRHHVEHLLRLDDAARLPVRAGTGIRPAVHRDVQGLPAAAEAVELQRRPDNAAIGAGTRRLTSRTTGPADSDAGRQVSHPNVGFGALSGHLLPGALRPLCAVDSADRRNTL